MRHRPARGAGRKGAGNGGRCGAPSIIGAGENATSSASGQPARTTEATPLSRPRPRHASVRGTGPVAVTHVREPPGPRPSTAAERAPMRWAPTWAVRARAPGRGGASAAPADHRRSPATAARTRRRPGRPVRSPPRRESAHRVPVPYVRKSQIGDMGSGVRHRRSVQRLMSRSMPRCSPAGPEMTKAGVSERLPLLVRRCAGVPGLEPRLTEPESAPGGSYSWRRRRPQQQSMASDLR